MMYVLNKCLCWDSFIPQFTQLKPLLQILYWHTVQSAQHPDYRIWWLQLWFLTGTDIFLLTTAFTLTLRHIKSPIQWALVPVSPVEELTNCLHPMPRLLSCGTILQFPHMFLWYLVEYMDNIYFYISLYKWQWIITYW
jgi:hypothetical protein